MRLTAREQQLLNSAANGLTDKQIGSELNISAETVASYWRGIRLKFQSSSRTECVALYSKENSASLTVKHEIESNELLNEIKTRTEAQARAEAQKNILQAITDASLSYITGQQNLSQCCDTLLKDVLRFTNADCGFISEVFKVDGLPVTRDLARSETPCIDIMNDAKQVGFTDSQDFGRWDAAAMLEQVTMSGKAFIENDHESFIKFLCVPVFQGDEIVGLIGLGCKSAEWDPVFIEDLRPVVATCANFISGNRAAMEQEQMLQQIAHSREIVRTLVDHISAGILYETPDRCIKFVNQTFIDMFGLNAKPSQLVGRACVIQHQGSIRRQTHKNSVVAQIEANAADSRPTCTEVFDLCDGRKFEREQTAVESSGTIIGYLSSYREVTRYAHTRRTDTPEWPELQFQI